MEEIVELLEQNKLAELKEILINENPIDIADVFEDFPKEKYLIIFKLLPKDFSSEVFSYLSPEKQQDVIENITDDEIKFIVEDMYLDDTVDFIEEMPANIVDKILKNTSSDKRKLINQMLKYPENSAGSVMTVEYISFKDNYTVKQAIEYYRKVAIDKEETDICFVTDTKKKLVGIISLKTLILSKDDSYIQDEMDTNFVSVLTLDDQEEIAALFRKYDLTTMPVVDHEDRLVGVITVDDIVDVIDQENTEDIQKMAAMNPSDEEYLKESVISLAKHRILWLLVLMISATFTGLVIKKYEDILQSAVYLATFIPMLMDTGGNAGSQSATLVIRGIALEEIEFSDIFKVIWKELRVSILVGFILSAVNFIRIYYFTRSGLETSLVVAISMFLTVIMAKVIGGVLPLVAKSLKIDPAIMASPLITTIVDTAALIIFFKLSVIFLHTQFRKVLKNMKKNLEILEKIYDLRYKSGKVHIFYSINKLVGRFGNVVSLDKIYVSKEYLSYLSEKLFKDRERLTSFFGGNNKFVRLSLVQEFVQDFGRDIAQDVKDDFLEIKQYNSSIFKAVKERMIALKENENEEITKEDIDLIQGYLTNWKKLQDKIKHFIPEEFYSQKNNYFYTSLLSYVKFLDKLNPNYEVGVKYLEEIK